MTEEEGKVLVKYVGAVDTSNKKMFLVTIGLMVVLSIFIICQSITVTNLTTKMADMSTKQWSAYMEADYYYPDISQSQKIEVIK